MTARLTLLLTGLLLSIPLSVSGQEDELYDLLTEYEIGECPQLVLNAEFLIPRYNDESQFDSIYMILDYIEQRCGPEHFIDYELLHSIEMGDYPDDFCGSFVIEEMLDRRAGPHRYWDVDDSLVDEMDSDFQEYSPYRTFLRTLAEALTARTDTNSVAHLVCRHYAGDHNYIMERLRRHEYAGSCLQEEYDGRITEIEHTLGTLRGHLAGGAGVWVPTGDADLLGPKLEITADVGLRTAWLGFDITGAVRLLESREVYELRDGNTTVITDDFVGGYIGGSLSKQLLSLKRYNLELSAGAGYDGFVTHAGDEYTGVNSFNVNFGLRLIYFCNKEMNQFGGFQLRYSMVDYDTGGGTDLGGGTISLNAVYGYMGDPRATSRANRLHYYDN